MNSPLKNSKANSSEVVSSKFEFKVFRIIFEKASNAFSDSVNCKITSYQHWALNECVIISKLTSAVAESFSTLPTSSSTTGNKKLE